MTELDDRTRRASEATERRAGDLARRIALLREEIGKVFLGQDELVTDLLVGILARGHVLLEGLPGLGKTMLVKALASGLGLQFSRVQFTPDLMPADVTGTRIVDDRGETLQFRFQRGPIFANLVLADEINRATPKTQSALLEAMQEGTVTAGGETHRLPRPFAVVATQNPIELEGTYPLPEAQLDRFLFKLSVDSPAVGDLVRVLDQTTRPTEPEVRTVLEGEEVWEFQELARGVICGEHLLRLVAHLIAATDPRGADADGDTRRLVRYGASPRAGQAIVVAAKVRALVDHRPAVSREDIARCALPALRHRVVLSFEAEADGVTVENLLPAWTGAAEKRAST